METEGGRGKGGGKSDIYNCRSTLQFLIMLTLQLNLKFSLYLSLPYCIAQGGNCVPNTPGEVIKLKFMINVVFKHSDAATLAGISPTPSPIPSPGSATRQFLVIFNVPNPSASGSSFSCTTSEKWYHRRRYAV